MVATSAYDTTGILFPSLKEVNLSGKFEIDFYGSSNNSGAAESQVMPRLRHAYMDINQVYGDTTVGFLAGQTWAPATPTLFPSLINPGAGWAMGNPWQRMPQIQLYGTQKIGDFQTGIIAAATRAMTGASTNQSAALEKSIDAGDASKMPMFQGQAFFKGKASDVEMFLAVGGAYGKEDYDKKSGLKGTCKDAAGKDVSCALYGEKIDVQMFNVGGKISHKYANLQGKFYMGKNLDVFGVFGGSVVYDQQITDHKEVVGSQLVKGFWGELNVKPLEEINIGIGYGAEDPDQDQDNATTTYEKNSGLWATANYTMFKKFTVGVQYLNVKTVTAVKTLEGNSLMFNTKLNF